ncbi:MAG: AAA family ATPase [Candidatus Hodarchaeales archaeon]|jgi:MoxR-like ATPase
MTKMETIEFCRQNLVALDDEIALLLRAIDQKISIIIKGESGTGKTELAKTIASALNRPFYRVDGDENLGITQLRGWFDPALAIKSGFGETSFIPGPLTLAMLNGGLFFFNEVNRAPSESINGVLAAMDSDERLLEIPQYKTITAKEEFYTIFTLNPLEYVGTNPLPEAFFDRCIQINLTHKSGVQAIDIVKLRTTCTDQELIERCVAFTEKTRTSHYFERGASIRATIQLTQLLMENSTHPVQVEQTINAVYSGKVKLQPDIDRSVEDCLSEIASDVFFSELPKKG